MVNDMPDKEKDRFLTKRLNTNYTNVDYLLKTTGFFLSSGGVVTLVSAASSFSDASPVFKGSTYTDASGEKVYVHTRDTAIRENIITAKDRGVASHIGIGLSIAGLTAIFIGKQLWEKPDTIGEDHFDQLEKHLKTLIPKQAKEFMDLVGMSAAERIEFQKIVIKNIVFGLKKNTPERLEDYKPFEIPIDYYALAKELYRNDRGNKLYELSLIRRAIKLAIELQNKRKTNEPELASYTERLKQLSENYDLVKAVFEKSTVDEEKEKREARWLYNLEESIDLISSLITASK